MSLFDDGQGFPETSPVERRPGVGLAARCDVGMADDVDDGVARSQKQKQTAQARVLSPRVGLVVDALELDTDGKIVAALAAAPDRRARVPRAARAGDELNQLAVAPDEEMRRHLQIAHRLVVGML